MPPDSSGIDQALVQLLSSDGTLLGLCPNGVYVDEAPQGTNRFVIVSLVEADDVQIFGGRGIEDCLFLVEARMRSSAMANASDIRSASFRIDELLEDATIAPTGYTSMTIHREKRIRLTEVDDDDESIRWYRRGGHYRVMMST